MWICVTSPYIKTASPLPQKKRNYKCIRPTFMRMGAVQKGNSMFAGSVNFVTSGSHLDMCAEIEGKERVLRYDCGTTLLYLS